MSGSYLSKLPCIRTSKQFLAANRITRLNLDSRATMNVPVCRQLLRPLNGLNGMVQIIRMKHKKAVFVPRREQISCRIEKENPLTDSPLVTLPDYTFMDGRPTPLGSNQMQRLMKQREWAGKIVTQLGELDFAKQRYAKLVEAKEEERQAILSSKLKEKGPKWLKRQA